MAISAPASFRLEGVFHFRDLGGHVTANGRTVRRRRMYRSGDFSNVTDQDRPVLQDLGINSVFDLRSEIERTRALSRWPQDQATKVILLNINTDLRTGDRSLWKQLFANLSTAGSHDTMIKIYRRMPRVFAHVLPIFIERLLEPDGLPGVIHCSAGKDRTGFLSALLLLALGVPRETVYSDYLLSTEIEANEQAMEFVLDKLAIRMGARPDLAMIRPLFTVKSEYLDTAFETITADYGSLEAYLAKAGGIGDAKLARLHELMLE